MKDGRFLCGNLKILPLRLILFKILERITNHVSKKNSQNGSFQEREFMSRVLPTAPSFNFRLFSASSGFCQKISVIFLRKIQNKME